ncbi:MAG: Quinone oxidoreductase 1 [Gammaproteobacteria bacterium]|nr:Quinone oxidoreductase 1 [Gammaproteobacteria bacterium]
MMHAIRIHEPGGPERMQWESVDVPEPREGEALVRHTAVGLNYIDVYHRTGLYPLSERPFGIGVEAAGVVEAVSEDVDRVSVGDRVAYVALPPGAYAEKRNVAASRLVRLPDSVDDRTAAAAMLQGMTAQYLLRRTYPVKPGDTILVHAAAGGVGLIVCQWAKLLGATVIGTVGSDEKAEIAGSHGCEHTVLYTREDFLERVKTITEGAGVDVVYDSVGQDTFTRSLDSLKPLGMLALFGQSSGPVAPLDLGLLAAKGSLFITRPTLFHYTASVEDLDRTAAELLELVGNGTIRIEVNQTYPLEDAAQAHRELEARKTTGSSVLLPCSGSSGSL